METEMITYELPPEPPVGTRLADKDGTEWVRTAETLWHNGEHRYSTWTALMEINGPLTEVPAPALPTEDGALIIASGVSSGDPFANKALVQWTPGRWYGDVRDGFLVAGRKWDAGADQITSWAEAVAVPKHLLDTLRTEATDQLRRSTQHSLPLGGLHTAALNLIAAVDGVA